MRIGVDLNGVIRDYAGQFLKCYKKYVDSDCEISYDDIDSFDLSEVFHFEDRKDYERFVYEDYAYELFAVAEPMERDTIAVFNDWTQNTLMDADTDEETKVMIFSPFEMGLTIQSSLSFMSARSIRCREFYFPVDSMTIYDYCDIVITANPNLIKNCPDGKTVFKIETPYNKNIQCEHTFKSLKELIRDEHETLLKILENNND